MNYIEKSKINKKLCIHCSNCIIFSGWMMDDRIMCGLERSPVDDSPVYSAFRSRLSPWKCGGKKWTIKENIKIVDTAEEAASLQREDSINAWMSAAERKLSGSFETNFTCGDLEEAVDRLKKKREQDASIVNNQ